MRTSVIITTYNRPEALERVVDGLRHQTRLPDEVIVADDGSGRETTDLVARLSQAGSFALHHVWHADEGFRAAAIRNRAINRAAGEYIISLDGDCIPERHFIADHLQLARRDFFYQGRRMLVSQALSGGFTCHHVDTGWQKLKLLLSGQVGNVHHLVRLPWLPPIASTNLDGVMSCNMGFFKDDLLAVNGFNEDFAGWGREDSELAVRLFNFGLRRKTHPFLAVCFHLWHPENDRGRLEDNDSLLASAKRTGNHVCKNGIVKTND